MNIELYTFAKTLKPSEFRAPSIKLWKSKPSDCMTQLENEASPPAHFRVSLSNLWSKGFKHDAVAKYTFVKEKLEDLNVAEKNLNRNIDSKAQLDLFLQTCRLLTTSRVDSRRDTVRRNGNLERIIHTDKYLSCAEPIRGLRIAQYKGQD